jgi:hypothetical protein
VLVTPWTTPAVATAPRRDPIDQIFLAGAVIFFLVVSGAGAALARRNLKLGRADRRGAVRVSAAIGAVLLVSWLLAAVHAQITTLASHVRAVETVALFSGLTWMVYLALEPYARKFWPHVLLGWSRVVAGHVRDPRVGGDLLAGVLCGIVLAYGDVLRSSVMPMLGFREPYPIVGGRIQTLLGMLPLVSNWLTWVFYGMLGGLITVLGLVLLRLLLRRTALVVAVASPVLMFTGANFMGSTSQWMWLFPLAQGVVIALVTVRFGLLTLVVARFVWHLLNRVPMTGDVSNWSAAASNWSLLLLVALVCYGFYASRAGQPLFGTVLRD